MTAWDIDPAGVSGVLEKAGTAAEGLASVGGQMQKTLPSAAKSAGTAVEGGREGDGTQGPVGAALGVFFTQWQKDLSYIAKRAGSSLNGAGKATTAYVKGDLDMAADAQAAAQKEPKIDMPGAGTGQGGGQK